MAKIRLRCTASPGAGQLERADLCWCALSDLALRRPSRLALLGLCLFALALPPAVRLYGDLRTDLRELLPRDAPASRALDALEQRIGGLSLLSIVVRTDDLQAGERFVDALAARLRELPPTLVRRLRYRIDDERAFFEAHGALYADVGELERARDVLRERIAEVKRKANPLVVELGEDLRPEPGSEAELRQAMTRLKEPIGRLDHFLDGYLAGDGGHTLVLLLTPAKAGLSLEENQRLFDKVRVAVESLRPQSFHPSIRIGYGGEVRGVIESQEALVHDLLVSSALVLLAVGGVLYVYYRRVRAIPLLVGPLFTGVAITFAVSRGVIHYLNPNTAFLGSIIVGNGINAGIILLARYLEERKSGAPVDEALPTALSTTWVATLVASAAAAASYASLGITGFRGFRQFAFVGGLGMLLCWIATYALMPPLLVLAERVRPLAGGEPARRGVGANGYAQTLLRSTAGVVALSTAITAAALLGVLRFTGEPIEYDFTKLGSRAGLRSGAPYWDKQVDAVMQSYQTPTVILTEGPERAVAVARAIEAARKAGGPESPIDSVATLQKLVPDEQPRKLVLLREIFSLIDARVLRALPDDLRPLVERLEAKTVLRPITLADVPAQLIEPFQEKDGRSGRLALVYPTLAATSSHGRAQMAYARAVRRAALEADPQAQVAGTTILTNDIRDAITLDGTFASLLSFLAVAGVTLLVMRSFRDAAWVIASLTLGTLWLVGTLGLFGLKLNFVNFVVLPITFGIGIDYAANFYQRFRQVSPPGARRPPAQAVEEALSTSGGAVALCSSTTILGYAALLVADNQGLFSFGLVAVLGELACLSAALFALPALLQLWYGRPSARGEPVRASAEAGERVPLHPAE